MCILFSNTLKCTATVSIFNSDNVSFKMHRKALFTSDCNVPGVSSTTVLTVGLPGLLVSQFADDNIKRLKAPGHDTIWHSCTATDIFDYVGHGSDEGIGLLTLIAARFGDASVTNLLVTSCNAHVPINMLLYKLSVTGSSLCILREHSGRKQQQTSQWDPHNFLLKKNVERKNFVWGVIITVIIITIISTKIFKFIHFIRLWMQLQNIVLLLIFKLRMNKKCHIFGLSSVDIHRNIVNTKILIH